MSFNYNVPETTTSESKTLQVKSFVIDIAAGDGAVSGTDYTIGVLPRAAQVIDCAAYVAAAVSGGTVSAATLRLMVGRDDRALLDLFNVFSAGTGRANNTGYQTFNVPNSIQTSDQLIKYRFTLTGAGPTAGRIVLYIYYVM